MLERSLDRSLLQRGIFADLSSDCQGRPRRRRLGLLLINDFGCRIYWLFVSYVVIRAAHLILLRLHALSLTFSRARTEATFCFVFYLVDGRSEQAPSARPQMVMSQTELVWVLLLTDNVIIIVLIVIIVAQSQTLPGQDWINFAAFL